MAVAVLGVDMALWAHRREGRVGGDTAAVLRTITRVMRTVADVASGQSQGTETATALLYFSWRDDAAGVTLQRTICKRGA
jgi:hypothetical protein